MVHCTQKDLIFSKHSALSRLFIYYFCSLIIAAILSPLCFNFVLFWDQYWPSKLTHYLVKKGFVIFFERIRMIALLLFLPSLIKLSHELQLFHKNSNEQKNFCPQMFFKYVLLGIALISLVVFMIFRSATSKYYFCLPEFSLINLFFLLKIIIGVSLLSFFEEWLFRGIIFKSIRQILPDIFAIIGASLLFAYFHFRPQYQPPVYYNLFSGFQCLYEVIFHTLKFIAWDKFALLFSFGALLSSAYNYTKSLLAPIGIHFGTVIALVFFQKNVYDLQNIRPISLQSIINNPLTYVLLWGLTFYFYIKTIKKGTKNSTLLN